jgi:hypothetical protein
MLQIKFIVKLLKLHKEHDEHPSYFQYCFIPQVKISTVILHIWCNLLYKGGPVSVRADERVGVYVRYGKEEKRIQGLGGKELSKHATWKT